MSVEVIKIPDLGGAGDVEVIEISVAVGDSVEVEDTLIVLESDKASMEVPSPMAGTITAITVKEGDEVGEGSAIAEIEVAGGAVENSEPEAAAVEPQKTSEPEKAEVAEPEQSQAQQLATSSEAEPAPASSTEPQQQTVPVPDIGSGDTVEVIEICVAEGETVSEGDSLVVLESEKASMEIPSPFSGDVTSILVKEGDSVSQGDALVEMLAAVQAAEKAPAEKQAQASAAAEQKKPVAAEVAKDDYSEELNKPLNVMSRKQARGVQPPQLPEELAKVYAGPAVRMLARELGVDLTKVQGTGPRNRIRKEDVQQFVKQALSAGSTAQQSTGSGIPPIPDMDFSQFGDVTVEAMSKMHKLTAANMQRNWLNIPHVTQFDDADITEMEEFRSTLKAEAEKRGTKITPMPFLLKACAAALAANPAFNASLTSNDEVVNKHYIHIGMAVDTPAGLVVPVIRDVDKKGIWDLSEEIIDLAARARDRKLKPAEMQGGCFSISSLGNMGGHGFTPIVNAPEVAILGVSRLDIKPVWNGSEFVPRKMLPLSLSYDHKAVNGAAAGKFLTELCQYLADIRHLVL